MASLESAERRDAALSGLSQGVPVVARLRLLSVTCAAVCGALAAISLLGWVAGIGLLERLAPGLPPMKANTAVGYLLASIALLGYSHAPPGSRLRKVATGCALVVALVGAVSLAEYVLGRNLGIDQLLFHDRAGANAPYPGRPAANASLGFTLLGAALLLWDVRVGRWWPGSALGWLAAVLGLLALTGYATGTTSLLTFSQRQHIALNSAVALALVSVGLLLARSDRGAMQLLASERPAGALLRRLLAIAVVVPLGVAMLTLAGERLDLFGTVVGAWLFASAVSISFGVSAWVTARSAERVEEQRRRAFEDLEEAQRLARMGSWSMRPGRTSTWSAQLYEILGCDPRNGPPPVEEFYASVHPDDRERAIAAVSGISDEEGFEIDYRLILPDGTQRVVHSTGHRDAVRGMVGTIQDVTAMRGAELAARLAEERFRQAFDEAPIGMALIEPNGRIDQANAAFAELCGQLRSAVEGVRLRGLLHPGDADKVTEALEQLAACKIDEAELELRIVQPVGATRDISVHGTLLRRSPGQPKRLLCQFQDVTERNQFEAQLQFLADHDPLTGLMNRRKFESELERHVLHVKRYGPEGALLVLDLDNFKSINDMLGHSAGDQLIVSTAGLIRSRLRDSDTLARLGGDEFAVILPRADQQQAADVAQALVEAVSRNILVVAGERKSVTTSIGVVMFNSDIELLTGESVLIEADLAMYDAKEAGRDRYAFSGTSEHRTSHTKARLTWVNRIEHALAHDRFALLAQPILDLQTHQVRQHELLLRMLDDEDELIPPASFLGIAERFGLISKIDQWVVTHAIDLIEQYPQLQLEVNISGVSLGDPQLLQVIESRLKTSAINPSRLIFEVTETAAVANITNAQAFASRLREHGCRFALDDFGAGFGSFYYLKHLPFDYVKIDGEFVQHAANGQIDQLVIEAVVRIAQGLGKETIAEFVTDEKTQRIVTRLGVDYAQGYHIGRPIPINTLLLTLPDPDPSDDERPTRPAGSPPPV